MQQTLVEKQSGITTELSTETLEPPARISLPKLKMTKNSGEEPLKQLSALADKVATIKPTKVAPPAPAPVVYRRPSRGFD